MIVKELLEIIGGSTNIVIRGIAENNKEVELWKGIGDDIKYPLIPYGKYEIDYISVNNNVLIIGLDYSVKFAEINPETIGMTAYIGTQVE